MNALEIIKKYYEEDTPLYNLLVWHSRSVAQKAVAIAQMRPELDIDINFVREASMIHDIGIFKTDAPEIHCFGDLPYICHGSVGSQILMKEGFPKYAMVCERHTGAGISLKEILKNGYPIPPRNMIPETLEEKLVCFADKFYSKKNPDKEKSIEKIKNGLEKHGPDSVKRFDEMYELFLG